MSYITFQPKDYFNNKLYTGDGNATNAITGVGFQPDWVWIKNRGTTARHVLFDAVRGSQKALFSHLTDAEQSTNQYGTLNSFDSDGFTVADGSSSGERTNNSSENYVSWNWKASGTSGSSNSDGSISSTVSANDTAGFSIVKYTGTGSAGNVGHGLSTAPKVLINKALGTQDWFFGHSSLGFTKFLKLNETNAESTNSGIWNDTAPTTAHFTINSANGNTNGTGVDYITYCFAEKKGYSKFGSYSGNGNADGPFIYTGFKPQFILWKRTDSANGWIIMDTKRSPFNVVDDLVEPQSSGAEATDSSYHVDYLSNGFKIRNTNNVFNNSSGAYVYMAFAEEPLVSSNNIPCTAR